MSYVDLNLSPTETDQRAPRKSQLIRATLGTTNGAHPIIVRNVSATGVGGVSPERPLTKGESVTILFRDDIMAQGTVAWANGERFGVALNERLNLDFLTDMIRQKQASTVEETTWEVRRLHKVHTPRLGDSSLLSGPVIGARARRPLEPSLPLGINWPMPLPARGTVPGSGRTTSVENCALPPMPGTKLATGCLHLSRRLSLTGVEA
jgi:hypothetical protein